MTTQAQVKALVKPLLERHKDLALVKRLIVVRPFDHVLRGVLIDRTSDPNCMNPRWLVDHLFEPRRTYHLSWGAQLYRRSHGPWDMSNPRTQEVLFQEIEENALPHLREIRDLRDCYEFVSRNYFRHVLFDAPVEKIVLDVALGNLDVAREISRNVVAKRSVDEPHLDDVDREYLRKVKALCALLKQDDREGMAGMLHEWEAEMVRNMKMEYLWEPTPFPLELD
jgi:hypothetical protein